MAVGFPVKDDYATGDVLTAANMNDFAGTLNTVPGSYGFTAGKNKIINGDFTINQRNFSSSTTSTAYGFDRFMMIYVDGTVTYSAQTFTAGTAPVAGYEAKNFARIVTSGQTLAGARANWKQPIENVRTLAGQTATVSFWAKAGSGTPKIAVELWQGFGSGGSPSAGVPTYAGQVTLSTSWARYSVTVAVPSISGKTIGTTENTSELQCNLFVSAGTDLNSRTGSLGIQSNTFDIWGVQVEAGSIATPFQTATGSLGGELTLCQRYLPAVIADAYEVLGFAYSTTGSQYYLKLPTTARVKPTGITVSNVAHFNVLNTGFSSGATTAIAFNTSSIDTASLTVTTTAGSPTLVASQPAKLQSVNASALILFTGCELQMETYTNTNGEECVIWTDENGSMHSMTKEAYDKKQAEQSAE